MKTLDLFNAVVANGTTREGPYVSDKGYIVEAPACWALDRIETWWDANVLTGNDLNKTFHKSWKKIKESSRCELLIHQIMHYLSTYGTNMQGEIYIPDEVLDLPDAPKLRYKVIKAYSVAEMREKCLNLLRSGMALKQDTITDVLSVLVDELDYTFTGKEGIKNKEAVVLIADLYGVYPADTLEFFRYILYRTTGDSLIIKSKDKIEAVKKSSFNPGPMFKSHGLEKLAEIFNRFKPLFLAYKKRCPKVINKISKLSKTYHKPLVINALNCVTFMPLEDSDHHWLENATPYALFKALAACHLRALEHEELSQDNAFVYRIRNGKSWVTEKHVDDRSLCKENMYKIIEFMKEKFDLSEKKFYFPKKVRYALPTSEKMYIGNVPTGTTFFGKKLAVGIYWENAWGAWDLDLSGMNIAGKIGWNAAFKNRSGSLMFSGDITNAPNGAVEYLYAHSGLGYPTLVVNNVFNGSDTSGYKIIVGKGDNITKNYMMNPNNLMVEIKTESIQKQMILGLFLPDRDTNKQKFVLLNFGAGNARVSGYSKHASIATRALYEQWSLPIYFDKIVKLLGGEIVDEPEKADFNFSLDALEKDSFTKVFEAQ